MDYQGGPWHRALLLIALAPGAWTVVGPFYWASDDLGLDYATVLWA